MGDGEGDSSTNSTSSTNGGGGVGGGDSSSGASSSNSSDGADSSTGSGYGPYGGNQGTGYGGYTTGSSDNTGATAGNVGGYSGDSSSPAPGLSSMYNAAQDSQAANVSLGLQADPTVSGPVNADDATVETLADKAKYYVQQPLSKVAMGLIGLTPFGQLANIGIGLATGNYGQAVSGALGGLPGAIAGIGVNAAMGQNVSGQVGATAGGFVGNAIGGPIGGIVGGWAGSNIGNSAPSSSANNTGGGSMGFNAGDTMTGLASAYSNYQNGQSINQASSLATNQANTLANIYGPNSPYAQQLSQQLDRADAASGRRSQYGPRAVDLQARLAGVASQNSSNTLAANQQALSMRNAGMTSNAQMLAGLYNAGKSSGFNSWATTGLSDLYHKYMGDGADSSTGSGYGPYGGNQGTGYGGYTTGSSDNTGATAGNVGGYSGDSSSPAPTQSTTSAGPSAQGAADYGASQNNDFFNAISNY